MQFSVQKGMSYVYDQSELQNLYYRTQDFLTGFVTQSGDVWGRPVGVTVGLHGDLYVTDDGSRSVWRVTTQ
jgi:glucose/arabinose dehydrogenase